MKFELTYLGGFSPTLVRWDATILVARRGSLAFRWLDDAGPHDMSQRRYDFGLSAESFERLYCALTALPEKFGSSVMDDAPTRWLRGIREGLMLERSRFLARANQTPAEEEFDQIWSELFALVQPAFLKLGIDAELLSKNR